MENVRDKSKSVILLLVVAVLFGSCRKDINVYITKMETNMYGNLSDLGGLDIIYHYIVQNNTDSDIVMNDEYTAGYGFDNRFYKDYFVLFENDTILGNDRWLTPVQPVTIPSHSSKEIRFQIEGVPLYDMYRKALHIKQPYYKDEYFKQYPTEREFLLAIAKKGVLHVTINGKIYKLKNKKLKFRTYVEGEELD